jgi:hypothetical protein
MSTSHSMSSLFYHFTSRGRLPGIAKYGLTVGDVPTDIAKHSGRIGVWLTTARTSAGHGLEVPAGYKVPAELEGFGKMQFRLEVEIPDSSPWLHKWTKWAKENCTAATIDVLHKTAVSFDTWYVYFGVIRSEAIVACVDHAIRRSRARMGEAAFASKGSAGGSNVAT